MKKFNQNGISIERDIKHPHIIQFYGMVIDTDHSIMFVSSLNETFWIEKKGCFRLLNMHH